MGSDCRHVDAFIYAALAARPGRRWHDLRRSLTPCDSFRRRSEQRTFERYLATQLHISPYTYTFSYCYGYTHCYTYTHSIRYSRAQGDTHAAPQANPTPQAVAVSEAP